MLRMLKSSALFLDTIQPASTCILHSHPMPLDLNCSPCNNLHLFDQTCRTWKNRTFSKCQNPQLCFWTQIRPASTCMHVCWQKPRSHCRGETKNCCHLHGMKALDDENLWRINCLRRVQETRHMVVNWLLDRFPFLECLHLLIHEIKIVGPGVQSRYRLLLPPIPIQGMVIIQTNDRGRIADKRIGIRVSTPGRSSRASEHARQSPHKCTLPTTGISRQANNHCLLPRCDFTHHHCTPSNSKSTSSNAATATTTMLPVHSQQQG